MWGRGGSTLVLGSQLLTGAETCQSSASVYKSVKSYKLRLPPVHTRFIRAQDKGRDITSESNITSESECSTSSWQQENLTRLGTQAPILYRSSTSERREGEDRPLEASDEGVLPGQTPCCPATWRTCTHATPLPVDSGKADTEPSLTMRGERERLLWKFVWRVHIMSWDLWGWRTCASQSGLIHPTPPHPPLQANDVAGLCLLNRGCGVNGRNVYLHVYTYLCI